MNNKKDVKDIIEKEETHLNNLLEKGFRRFFSSSIIRRYDESKIAKNRK